MAARCPQRYDDSSISGIRALVAAAFLTAGPQPSPVRTWMCPSSWSAPRDKDESSVLHHTPLAQLGKHLVLKGLKHKDPEPTFQLALATPASCGSALINSSALPFHSSQPDTFSIALFSSVSFVPCKRSQTPCFWFLCTNWLSLSCAVRRVAKTPRSASNPSVGTTQTPVLLCRSLHALPLAHTQCGDHPLRGLGQAGLLGGCACTSQCCLLAKGR